MAESVEQVEEEAIKYLQFSFFEQRFEWANYAGYAAFLGSAVSWVFQARLLSAVLTLVGVSLILLSIKPTLRSGVMVQKTAKIASLEEGQFADEHGTVYSTTPEDTLELGSLVPVVCIGGNDKYVTGTLSGSWAANKEILDRLIGSSSTRKNISFTQVVLT